MIPPTLEEEGPLPNIPRSFGEDGGKFYKYYDDLSDELDEDMVKSLKSQLDGILIFAGLFAGVNSTFLALTLPQMKPDPADDTNALLLQVAQGRNGTIQSPADLPSASFSPPPGIYPVNVLLSMSLTLALLSSFLAVLGQQWLVQYRRRSGGGAEHQRWEQLRRYLGAKKWHLEPVLDHVLPGLLQLAMIIFCTSFAIYLSTLSESMCIVITAPIGLVVAILIIVAALAAWDQWCPFQSPLSHLMQITLIPFARLVGHVLISFYCTSVQGKEWVDQRLKKMWGVQDLPASPVSSGKYQRLKRDVEMWYESLVCRPPEPADRLKLVALKRVIAISEDPRALTYAALNVRSIYKKEDIRSLIADVEFFDRLRRLSLRVSDGGIRLAEGIFGPEQARMIGTSFLYMVLSGGSMLDLLSDSEQAELATRVSGDETAFLDFFESAQLSGSVALLETEHPCAACCSCVELKLCGGLMAGVAGWALSTRDIYLRCLAYAVRRYNGRGSPQLLCILSTLVNLLKEGSNTRHGRIQSTSRKMEILQSLPDIYSSTKQASQMGRLVGTAIASSASVWPGRPEHDVYVYLFKEGCFLADLYGDGLEAILENVGSLLVSIEKSILDADVISSERKAEIDNRSQVVQALVEVLSEPLSTSRKLQVCNAASSSVSHYLEWLAEMRRGEYRNHETVQLLEELRPLLDGSCFPEPEALLPEAAGTSHDLVARYHREYLALHKGHLALKNILGSTSTQS